MRRRESLIEDVELGGQSNLDDGPQPISGGVNNPSGLSDLVSALVNALRGVGGRAIYLQIRSGPRGRLELRQIEFLDIEDLARLTKVEPRTVHGWVQRGISPTPYRPPGSRCLLFEMSEAIAWIKQTAVAIPRHGE